MREPTMLDRRTALALPRTARAADDIDAAGGSDDRKLKIVFEDTQGSNSIAVNAFIKLPQQFDPVFIFLSSHTIQNLAVE